MKEYSANTFRFFVSDYFVKIKDYLKNGILIGSNDLDKNQWLHFWANHIEDNNNYKGFKSKKIYELRRYGEICLNNGILYVCLGVEKSSSKSIIERPLEERGIETISFGNDSYIISRLALVKEENSVSNSNRKIIIKIYTFSDFSSITKYVISRQTEGMQEEFFLCDFILNFHTDDSGIWDSFFSFFAIVKNASQKKEWEAAALDLEQGVKTICGQPAHPLRFLVGLGDQYLKYIFEAFNFEKGFREKNRDTDRTFNNRIKYLENIFPTTGREYKELLRLLRFFKEIRNAESHNQVRIEQPINLMANFIMVHVILIYVLKYILNYQLRIDKDLLYSLKENLYFPVTVQNGIILESSQSESFCKLDDYHYFMPAFAKFDIRNLSGESKEYSIENLNISGIEIRESNGKFLIHDTGMLQLIDRIEYNPIIVAIQKQLEDIREHIGDKEEKEQDIKAMLLSSISNFRDEIERKFNNQRSDLEKKLQCRDAYISKDQLSFYLDECKSSIEYINTNFSKQINDVISQHYKISEITGKHEAWINKQRKRHLVIGMSGVIIFLILFSVLIPSNIKSLAIRNETIYGWSQNFCILHDKGDISYERARYIEKEMLESFESINFVSDSIYFAYNPQREKAYNAYRNAIRYYENENVIKTNPNAPFRLSLLYATGKGGVQDLESASKYAKIDSVRNGSRHKGYHDMLKLYSTGNSDYIEYSISEGMVENDGFVPYIASLKSIIQQEDSVDWSESARRILYDDTDDCMEVKEIISLQLIEWALHGNNEKISKDPFLGLELLSYAAVVLNSPVAQNTLASIYVNMGLSEQASIMLLSALSNGYGIKDEVSVKYLVNKGFYQDSVISRYPFLRDKLPDSYSYGKKLDNILNLISDGDTRTAYGLLQILARDTINDRIQNLIRHTFFSHPDSADSFLRKIPNMKLSSEAKFCLLIDSVRKHRAVEDYVKAIYGIYGFGSRKISIIEADSLLRASFDAGFVPAIMTMAIRMYNEDKYHSNSQLCIDLMSVVAPYSDDACIWLSEKLRNSNPDRSAYFVSMINDSLNQFRLIRELDDLLIIKQYAHDLEVSDSIDISKKYNRIANLLKRTIELESYQSKPKFFGTMLTYITDFQSQSKSVWINKEWRRYLIGIYAASKSNPGIGLYMHTLNRMIRNAPDSIKPELIDFQASLEQDLRKSGAIDLIPRVFLINNELNKLPFVKENFYFDLTWADNGYDIPEFILPSKLFTR